MIDRKLKFLIQESERQMSDFFLLNGFAPSERNIPVVNAADLVRNRATASPKVLQGRLTNGVAYELGLFKAGYVGIARNECGLVLYKDFYDDPDYKTSNFHIQETGEWDEASLRQPPIDPCSQPPPPETTLPSIPILAELLNVLGKPGYRELVCRDDGHNLFAVYRFHERSRYGPKLREQPDGVRDTWIRSIDVNPLFSGDWQRVADWRYAMPEVEAQRFCRMLAIKRNKFIKQVQTPHV